jgi:hypothetical protein
MKTLRLTALALAIVLGLVAAEGRRRAVVPPRAVSGPTFSKEVVRILQNRCQSCHHEGDIAPFPLITYADAASHAMDIRLMVKTHQMPPWKPTAGIGDFADARVLTQDEIDTLVSWAQNGAPEGNRLDLPDPLQFAGGWAAGQPDAVFTSSAPYTPPSTGDMYRCFSMPTNLTSDKYVSGIDVRPGDRQTVHHVIAFIDTTGASQKLDDADPAPGYQCFGGPGFTISSIDSATLGGWAPGARPVLLPEGVSLKLPAGSRIVLQVHYHPHGTPAVADQTQIGVYYSKTKPNKLLRILPLINQNFTIPPNDPNYRVTASFPVLLPVHLWLIAPHMHLLGRKMHVIGTAINGQSTPLIDIQDWDFNWQGQYRYKDPVALPYLGTVSLEAYYDNSDGNFRNPNLPPKPVSWGEATTDEMCIAFLGVTLDSENLAAGVEAPKNARIFGDPKTE